MSYRGGETRDWNINLFLISSLMAKATKPKPTPTPNPHRPNFWGMISQMWAVSVSKGQAPLLGLIGLFILIIARMPAQNVGEMGNKILHEFALHYIGGWALSVILVFVAPIVTKRLIKGKNLEIERLNKRKEELEQLLLDSKK